MTLVTVRPATAVGRVAAPPSKSYTHRALVAGHLAGTPYRILRPLDAEDTRATARAVGRLGTPVERGPGRWTVRPAPHVPRGRSVTIDCGESGTTLRFVAALAALQDRPITVTGRPRLAERPMATLLDALEDLGARIRRPGRGLPLAIRGPIRAGSVHLDAAESSQFASALLLILPTLRGDSEVRLEGPTVSRPYLEATIAVLGHHGIHVRRRGRRFYVPGGQRYRSPGFAVPGDASSAAYLWAAAAITGGDVEVEGVPPGATWPQADLELLSILERQGAKIRAGPDGVRVRGGRLRPFSANLTDAPDLYPLAGTIAAVTPGRSYLRGAVHVAVKESDRRTGTIRLARSLGARVRAAPDQLEIDGRSVPRPLRLRSLRDHRMVMSAAIGALAARGPSRIGVREAVNKSFPGFWSALGTVTDGRAFA